MYDADVDHGKKRIQSYSFDFFNYAGIHRSVMLCRTPAVYIQDISLTTDVTDNGTGVLGYQVKANKEDGYKVEVAVFDKNGTRVESKVNETGQTVAVTVNNAKLWWPYLMHADPGYLYQLEVQLKTVEGVTVDIYRMKFGFRKISWNEKQLLINGKPIYFRGFGRHEDSDVSQFNWTLRNAFNQLLTNFPFRFVAKD